MCVLVWECFVTDRLLALNHPVLQPVISTTLLLSRPASTPSFTSLKAHPQQTDHVSLQFSGESEGEKPDKPPKTIPRWKRRAYRTIKTTSFFLWSGLMIAIGSVGGTIAYVADRHSLKPTELGYRDNQEAIF